MSELLRELQEDLHQERLHRLWHSFGKVIIGLSITIILGTVVMVAWQNYSRAKAAGYTGQLMKAADRIKVEDYKGAIVVFDELTKTPGGRYYSIAMLRKAEAQTALGTNDAAMATYRTLAQNSGNDASDSFGALAKLLAANDADAPISVNEDSAFHHSERERRAWQLLAAGKKTEAAHELSLLRDNDAAPQSLRLRAAMALNTLPPAKTDAKAVENE